MTKGNHYCKIILKYLKMKLIFYRTIPLNFILPYFNPRSIVDNRHTFYNIRKANYSSISSYITGFDWKSTLASLSLEAGFNIV